MMFPELREPLSALTHGVGLVVAVPAALALSHRGRDLGPGRRLALAVFGTSLVGCYAASTLFHAARVGPATLATLDHLDRIGIFALIAGTYTPLAATLLRGVWRWGTLLAVWGVAAAASAVLVAAGPDLSPAWTPAVCLLMGWGVLLCYGRLVAAVGHRALAPLVVGGVSYSVGAALNFAHWPNPWPGWFGSHEVFHLFVLAGSLAHYHLMTRVVVPFPEGETVPDRTRRIGLAPVGHVRVPDLFQHELRPAGTVDPLDD